MELTWVLLVISFGLFFTKAKYLGTPYRLASIFYLALADRLDSAAWYTFVAVFCLIDYLCARFYMNKTDGYSHILKVLLLFGVVVHFFLGVDLAFETNIVYDAWERIIQGLNILQIITLIVGGYSAGLVDRRWYVDKYSRALVHSKYMVDRLYNRRSGFLEKWQGKKT